MTKLECGRCGCICLDGATDCPACSAPLPSEPFDGPQDGPPQQGGAAPAPNKAVRVLIVLVAALLLAMVALLVLLLDRPASERGIAAPAAALPTAVVAMLATTQEATQTPTPQEQPLEQRILGSWIAQRVEAHSARDKVLKVDMVLGAFRPLLHFVDDGGAQVQVQEGEPILKSWYAQGDSVFIDYGQEEIGADTYFGRTRFFFREDVLCSVYTLDGKDVSDRMVYVEQP